MSGQGDNVGGIPSWARIGAKVVCIDAAERPGPGGWAPIEHGATYILRWAGYTACYPGIPAVRLVGIHRPECCGEEAAYSLARFRPLIARSLEQDVARFRKHLRTKRKSGSVEIPHYGEVT